MSSVTLFAGDSDLDMVAPGGRRWRRVVLGTSATLLVCGAAAVALCYNDPSFHASRVSSSTKKVTLNGGDLTRLFLEVSGSPEDSHSASDVFGKALVGDWDASVLSGNADDYFDELLSESPTEDSNSEEEAATDMIDGLQQKVAMTVGAQDGKGPLPALPKDLKHLPCPHQAVHKLRLAFAEADEDHDGVLKGKEMDTILGAMQDGLDLPQERFEELRANITDGATSWDFPEVRMLTASLYLFKLADANKDNFLGPHELKSRGVGWAKHFVGPMPQAKWHHCLEKANWTHGKLTGAALGELLSTAWGSVLSPPMAALWKDMDADRSGELEDSELVSLGVELRSRFMLRARDYEGLVTTDHMDQLAFKHLFIQARSRSPFAKLPPPVAKFFMAVDKDRSGSVGHAEVVLFKTMLMQKLSMNASSAQTLIDEADKDANGELSVDEFGHLMTRAWGHSPFAGMSGQTIGLFHWADKDHDLVLDGPELAPMARAMHKVLHMPHDHVERELELGAGSDSELTPQELKKVLNSIKQ